MFSVKRLRKLVYEKINNSITLIDSLFTNLIQVNQFRTYFLLISEFSGMVDGIQRTDPTATYYSNLLFEKFNNIFFFRENSKKKNTSNSIYRNVTMFSRNGNDIEFQSNEIKQNKLEIYFTKFIFMFRLKRKT